MPGRVFVTGGSGFVGSAVIRQLLARGFGVNALVNRKSLPNFDGGAAGADVRSIQGDLFDASAMERAMAGCLAVIHLVGIIREDRERGITFEKMHVEGTAAVVRGAVKIGIARYVQMSAMGARGDAASEYHKTKQRGEEIVRSSGLQWTIIRPSLIHGPGGEFMTIVAGWARKKAAPYLFMPYFGRGFLGNEGAALVQPVYVEDVARAFVDAIENPKAIGKSYELGGDEQFNWPQMHQTASMAIVGKNRLTLGIPAWYAKLLTRIVPGKMLPFNRDQVIMSQEDNIADIRPFMADFGWEPRGFTQTVGEYAGRI